MAKTKKVTKKRVAKKRATTKKAVEMAPTIPEPTASAEPTEEAEPPVLEKPEAPVEEKAKESNGGRVVSRILPKRIIGR